MSRKLIDNEIIKALEELLKELKSKKQLIVPEQGVKNLCYGLQNFLDLINRLQEKDKTRHKVFETKCEELKITKAENERLKGISDNKTKELLRYNASIEELHKKLETAKSEAYKEFAEKMNKEAEEVGIDREGDFVEAHNKIYDTVADWCKATSDNLLKELVGSDETIL